MFPDDWGVSRQSAAVELVPQCALALLLIRVWYGRPHEQRHVTLNNNPLHPANLAYNGL